MTRWAAVVVIALACAGCGVDHGARTADKAGGGGRPVTLRLAVSDGPGNASARAAVYFAHRVRQLSDGRLRVGIAWQAAGDSAPRWELRVVDIMRRGDAALAMVPARAWAQRGVGTLDALMAPFLITSDAVLRRVVDGPLTGQMLAGLDGVGAVGLAMVPAGLRHEFSFARPLLTRADYAGATIRAPFSSINYDTLRSLGARPVDLNGRAFAQAVARGKVRAAESGFELASGLPQRAIATGNVTPSARIDVLAASQGAFSKLSGRDRSFLREAARDMTRHSLSTGRSEALLAKDYCAAGGAVTLASPASVRALVAATAPVTAGLERAPSTRRAIKLIRSWASPTAGPKDAPAHACGSTTAGTRPVPSRGATPISVLDGVYRIDWSQRDMVAAGVSPDYAYNASGIQTWTLHGGRYVWHTDNGRNPPDCRGRYTITGRVIFANFNVPGGCTGTVKATWTLKGNLLYLRVIGGTRDDHIYFSTKPWRRIAAPAGGPG